LKADQVVKNIPPLCVWGSKPQKYRVSHLRGTKTGGFTVLTT